MNVKSFAYNEYFDQPIIDFFTGDGDWDSFCDALQNEWNYETNHFLGMFTQITNMALGIVCGDQTCNWQDFQRFMQTMDIYEENGVPFEEWQADYLANNYRYLKKGETDPRTGDKLSHNTIVISPTLTMDIKAYGKEKIDDFYNSMKPVYTSNFNEWGTHFASKQRFDAIMALLNENKTKLCFLHFISYPVSDPTGVDDANSVQQGGARALYVGVVEGFHSLVYYRDGIYGINAVLYDENWNKIKHDDVTWYGFAQKGDVELSEISFSIPTYNQNPNNDFYSLTFSGLQGSNATWTNEEYFAISNGQIAYPLYKTTDIMKR